MKARSFVKPSPSHNRPSTNIQRRLVDKFQESLYTCNIQKIDSNTIFIFQLMYSTITYKILEFIPLFFFFTSKP